jgi:hypothetical protein
MIRLQPLSLSPTRWIFIDELSAVCQKNFIRLH